jgi:hypothetical protein
VKNLTTFLSLTFSLGLTFVTPLSAQSRAGIDYVDPSTMNARLNGYAAKRATNGSVTPSSITREKVQSVDLPVVAASALSTPANTAPSTLDTPSGFSIRPSDGVLRRSLERWAAMAGFQLAWDVDRDHSVSADANFGDDFKGALGKALASTAHSDVPLRACMHDQGGKPLVRIIRATALCQ